jgi:dimethylhistidine N-methyltransferase
MISTRFRSLGLGRRNGPTSAFRTDVITGLRSTPKELPCKYFYDDAGSRLFEQVCDVTEYYLTRTELGIMAEHALDMADLMGPRALLIEYGSGSSVKTRLLLDYLKDVSAYIPVDISGKHLRESAGRLAMHYPHIDVVPVWADFTRPFELPATARPATRRVVYFPGSTLGNFTPQAARDLLRQTARRCGPGGGMLLGVDLKKDPAIITAAYNDSEGISAAFNLNILTRINRELGADFQVDKFWHHAFYHPIDGRMEMHLVSQEDQLVCMDNQAFQFADGEPICTEYSYKYNFDDLDHLAADAGFELGEIWVDARRYFAVAYLTVASI